MVQVHYANYRYNSKPNTLPTVYEYRFTLADFATLKIRSVANSFDEKERVVQDWHGMY
jgi:hypothetical protein